MLERTNNNIKQKWQAINVIINRKKIKQHNCIIPNNILGQHYASVAEKLAKKLPNICNDDIPSTSTTKYGKKITKHHFNFNIINERGI